MPRTFCSSLREADGVPPGRLAPVPLAGESDTVRLGRLLAGALCPGDAVLLEGAIGTGKTVLARAILRSLAGDPALVVPSPTYTLAQAYELPCGTVHHFDLYRLEGPADCVELGLEDVFGIDLALVEWPDRLGIHVPEEWVRVRLDSGGGCRARRAELAVQGPASLLGRMECVVRRFVGRMA